MKFSTKLLLLTGMFFILALSAYAQKKNYVGIHYAGEWMLNRNQVQNGIGITFDKQLLGSSGIETGFYMRTCKADYVVNINSTDYKASVHEFYLHIPILYKYYSPVINVAVGPTLDYFASWSQGESDPKLQTKNYNVSPKTTYGLLSKISKTFHLYKNFNIEPEVRYNYMFRSQSHLPGIGVSIKYGF